MKRYQVVKTFGSERGFSCCFRQWRANHSHCSTLHGYALGFEFVIGSDELDSRNWVYDYGNFKDIKTWLEHTFDHTLVVAEDDPLLPEFRKLNEIQDGWNDNGCVQLRVLPHVGCEKFAEYVFNHINDNFDFLKSRHLLLKDVELLSVKVSEHGSNAAVYNKVD